jgi:hypothetical protein
MIPGDPGQVVRLPGAPFVKVPHQKNHQSLGS